LAGVFFEVQSLKVQGSKLASHGTNQLLQLKIKNEELKILSGGVFFLMSQIF
jgi:hypothetical protein